LALPNLAGAKFGSPERFGMITYWMFNAFWFDTKLGGPTNLVPYQIWLARLIWYDNILVVECVSDLVWWQIGYLREPNLV